ncbi:hypothetical protein J2743_001665 [Methanobacterium petrolearium]|nr:hypothetical protein [Methanobacterium petrolearium]
MEVKYMNQVEKKQMKFQIEYKKFYPMNFLGNLMVKKVL